MEFRILGPLEILDGERRLPLGGPKRRAVAALLLLDANRVVSSERLIDGVWGDDPPAGALASLQNHVLRLRRELGDRIVTRAPGYVLRVEPDELDLDRFRRLVQEAAAREPGEAAAQLREALALWRGQPLADLALEPVAAASAGIEEERLDAVERRIAADLALSRHVEVVPELEMLVEEQPFRESLRAQLMLALYRAGRQADALEVYAAVRATLVEELGAEPGRELQALQRAVLEHDPALDGPSPPPRPAAMPELEEARKTVTILLADLHGEAKVDPEARREQLRRVHERAAAAVEAEGGSVGRTADDRVLGIFGVPLAHEDDAFRAVRAASTLRAEGLITRAAVATGDVITGDPARGRPLVSGAPLDDADRLRGLAEEGDVLAGERTWRLVRHGVTGSPRDGAYSVIGVRGEPEAIVRRLDSPLVGREDELEEVLAAFRRTWRDGRARLVTVFGSPGIGKTRLAREVVNRLSELATCLVGRTPSYEDAPTYAPLRDAFASLAQGSVAAWASQRLAGEPDGERAADRIAALSGEAGVHGPVEETAWAVRRLLETLAAERPVVLVLEDLHWASSAFLDLVQHVATLARSPILLLVLARPELLDTRPEWAGGSLSATSILLDALPPQDARDLLDRLAAPRRVTPEQREAILAAAGGNPLFLEQLLAAALEDGAATVPDSIHALLTARLDRLADDERRVAQAGAVCGTRFPTALLQSLLDVDVGPVLLSLARRDLVELDSPDSLGGESWAFRHALVRDEVYATLPKRRRGRLHEQIATELAGQAVERGLDASELVGYHFEAAYLATREVEPAAPELGRLGREAARHLAAAGRHAYEERDMATAAALLGRAVELVPADAPERLPLATRLADALGWTGALEAGLRVLDEAETTLGPTDERARARLTVARHNLHLWGPTPEDPARVLADTRNAIAVFEEAGDHEGLAVAHVLAYQATYRLVAPQDPVAELTLAVEHARAAGERALEGVAASWLCIVLRRGLLPVSEGRRRILEILEHPPTEYARASALGGLADLRAMEGAFDEARALVAENHAILEELGLPQTAAADLIAVADVELLAGDLSAAERILREALERLAPLGDRFSAVNAAWRLALVLIRQGRHDDAELVLEGIGVGEGGDYVQLWRSVLGATLAARRGRRAQALELLDDADRGMGGWASGSVVDVLLQLAEVSELLGDRTAAAARLRRAAEMADGLGYVVGREAAEKQLAGLRVDG